MDAFKNLFKVMPNNTYNLVFYSPDSKYKVLSNNGANKLLKKLLKEMGVKPITLHGLRHTHASVLLYRKVSIFYVSERLGHKDIETTYKYYTHVIKELRVEDEQSTTKIFEKMVG